MATAICKSIAEYVNSDLIDFSALTHHRESGKIGRSCLEIFSMGPSLPVVKVAKLKALSTASVQDGWHLHVGMVHSIDGVPAFLHRTVSHFLFYGVRRLPNSSA